ncbi:MAG: bifunctional diaminohydroxyphosphoribosylaminopyrimidine deaminase/5-amino-6-(5-phosphoribosylamino)uracil reductase RibD [Actinobacteria bacterium]|nr:bifunctional diaminohydroxyphosphoribosylaminopyrimidine deaminase/5-amino-6-(5-phosphoribosylamino)uracil reductase RibD [Actinomycetota bacterium]
MFDETLAMKRALQLSEIGLGLTSPNPIVGAVVISSSGQIVGEGFHQRALDLRHAEVIALSAAGDKAKGATLVLTLEPCNHIGKTPPCTDAIISAGIKRVVYAVSDPNPIAQGGSAKLFAAGIDVSTGLLEQEVRFSNRAWFTKIEKSRPYITLKIATSLDGKVSALYASRFAAVNQTLSQSQRDALIKLRNLTVVPKGVYDFSTLVPMPTLPNTDYFFGVGSMPATAGQLSAPTGF